MAFLVSSGGGATPGEAGDDHEPAANRAFPDFRHDEVVVPFDQRDRSGNVVVLVHEGKAACHAATYLPDDPPSDEFTIPPAPPGSDSR